MAAQITPQEIETIREMFDQGHTRAAIAEAMCRDYSTVKRLVARITYNRTDTRRYKPRTPGLTVRVREGVAAGLSYSEIARRTGYAKTTVIRHATTDAQTRTRLRNPDPPPEVIETIRQRLVAGDTLTEISRLVRRTRTTVVECIQRHNLRLDATPAQIDAMFAAGHRSDRIALRTGMSHAAVEERRAEWRSRRRAEKLARQEARAAGMQQQTPPDKLGAELARFAPLASLPDRVAVLGIPVVVRRAA